MDLIYEALIDTLKLAPFLIFIYILIEYVEFKFSHTIYETIEKAGRSGPFFGSIAGAIPQCGFSVMSTALFVRRFITIGTLIAVYLSTSDEAIPIILADPSKAGAVVPLILFKVVIAIISGLIIDAIFQKRIVAARAKAECIEEIGCCGHQCDSDKLDIKEVFIHPIWHTLKILLFIFAINVGLNFLLASLGQADLERFFLKGSFFQPVLAAFFGLIPNCAASVAIAKLYLNDVIGFGATIAGLSAGAGLGLIVLFREKSIQKEKWLILGLLLSISIFWGILIQIFYN